MTDDTVVARHRRSRGMMDDAEVLRKKAFVRSRPPALPEQKFAQFSRVAEVHMINKAFAEKGYGEFAPMNGENAIEYV